MTALQPLPGPEKPGKDEKPFKPDVGTPFSGFPPFPALGTAQDAALPGAAAALAAVRSYRRVPTPKPPRSPRRKPPSTGGRTARAGLGEAPAMPTLPGVPPDWCEGVALLTARPAPPTILPRRWAALAVTSARMLRNHGAALHGAGWDALELFGLHSTAPMTHPPGWGLAWLLGEHGEILDLAPDVIGMCWGPDGARLAYRRRGAGRGGAVPAWLVT